MSHDVRRNRERDQAGTGTLVQAKAGALNLTDSAAGTSGKVGGSTLVESAGIHQVAAGGVAGGGGGQLPHLAAIQQAFGHHDVSGIQAHVGGAAGEAAGALGTEAYATGNQVAFAGAPSLHTAAHEAAHVVQQRAGVQLKGGLSSAGDHLEQHADAVADLVVQGKSAQGLLDRHAGGGGGGGAAVQAKGGKLGSQVLPRFRAAPNQKKTILESLPAAAGGRDTDGNETAKIALENAIATWVVTNNASFVASIKSLSHSIGEYLALREEHIEVAVATSLARLTPDATTYGRMAGAASYPDQLRALLRDGTGSMHEHLLVQQMFVDKIYNQDVRQIIDELSGEFSGVISDPMEKDALKPPAGAIDVGVGTMTYENAHNNARAAERSQNNIPKVATGGLGPHSAANGNGAMIRGTDKFTAVEKNAFTQSARLMFNMPVSGTGLSGSATDLFTCAKLFDMADAQMRADYALAAFSFFAKAGAHTFHEVMLMAKSAGFSEYVPGNYISAIPAARRVQLRADLAAHAALLADPVVAGPAVQAADGHLHGWKDELTLDGDVDGWEAKVKTFLATRFGVAGGAVTITPITDGRSGDMVYKVVVARDVGGPYNGIFKVFNDADMADTEIEIGDKMRDLGVNTPANRGVARVETSAENPSKAAVLFDLAEGETPHSLVKRIGALAVDAGGRPALVAQLERAVIAVAKQLSKLHGKAAKPASKVGRVEGPAAMKAADQMDKGVKGLHEKGLYELHRDRAVEAGHLSEDEKGHVTTAFDALLKSNLTDQKLRKSMTHGDANAANFIVDGDVASVIDVNTASQSFGPDKPDRDPQPIKTGAADTGRFLETLRTAHPGALTAEEMTHLDAEFHKAYMPGSADQPMADKKPKETDALAKIDAEKAADEKAEVYYRACWILNQISHAPSPQRLRANKERLIELVPALDGKLVLA